MSAMTPPREIVHELNKHIVGQEEAKRAVAIALRNRWRRMQLDSSLRDEITPPKNILMIGPPTGVGKTEIAPPPVSQTGGCSLPESGSHQIYRSGLCRPGC